MICLLFLCLVLILLVLFYIKAEKAAYDRLTFDFMDEFAGHTEGTVSETPVIPVVHERMERLPEEDFSEQDEILPEDEELEEHDTPEEFEEELLPWDE